MVDVKTDSLTQFAQILAGLTGVAVAFALMALIGMFTMSLLNRHCRKK